MKKSFGRRRLKRQSLTSDDLWGYAFIAMALFLFFLFTLYPVISAFITSFEKYRPLGSVFIGLDNYKTTFTSKLFLTSVINTAVYTLCTVPLSLVLSFSIAVLMIPFSKRAQSFFKALYYLPSLASTIALSVVWLWIYDPMPTGLLNSITGLFGIQSKNWLGSSQTAMFSLVLMALLSGQGANIIIYLAALLNLPSGYFEAAELDGARFMQKLRYIVIPLMQPATLFLLVTGVIGSFQVFMNAYMMTGGGPNNATTMVGLLIFNNAFKYSDYGLACAQSLILAAVIALISLAQFRLMGENVEY